VGKKKDSRRQKIRWVKGAGEACRCREGVQEADDDEEGGGWSKTQN